MKKALWSLLALSIFLSVLWQFFPLPDAKEQFANLPPSGPNFNSKEIPLTEDEKAIFHDVSVLKRLYTINNKNFFVILIDGTNNRHTVHDPRYCIRGSGWTITQETPFKTPNGEANLLTTIRNDQKRETLFWFSDGMKQFASPLQYWYESTLRRLTLGRSGNEPILIFVQPVDSTKANWNDLKTHFKALFKV